MPYGPEAVHELINKSELSYPISVSRLENKYALKNIEINAKGDAAMLVEILDRGDFDRFESQEDLEEKLTPVFEAEIKARRSGIIGRIKRILFRW